MKKMIATALLSVIVLGAATTTAKAAPEQGQTTGDITFKADEDREGGNPVEPTEPGEEEYIPVDPDGETDGTHTKGALRFEHVPHFHFDENIHSSKDEQYPAIWPTVDGNDAAIFAQVTDETGDADSRWSVSVSQTAPFKSTTSTLDNSRVMVYAGQVFMNTSENNTETLSKIAMGSFDAANGTKIGVASAGESALEIMRVKAGETTNGVKTSFVFSGTSVYDASTKTVTGDKNEHLKLHVPKEDNTVNETYTATFDWVLTNGL